MTQHIKPVFDIDKYSKNNEHDIKPTFNNYPLFYDDAESYSTTDLGFESNNKSDIDLYSIGFAELPNVKDQIKDNEKLDLLSSINRYLKSIDSKLDTLLNTNSNSNSNSGTPIKPNINRKVRKDDLSL